MAGPGPGAGAPPGRRLAENARPENARYRYDYYTDNCATRVRDALDRALGGALRRQMEVRSRGDTYRSESVRLASPAPWMWLGFDIGLGPYGDRPLSRWEQAFLPTPAGRRPARSDAGRRPSAGRSPKRNCCRSARPPEPVERPRVLWPWLLLGLAAAVVALAARARRAVAGVAAGFWLACGTARAWCWC